MSNRFTTVAADPLKGLYLIAWAVILGLLALIFVMWGFNIAGLKGVNTPIALISFLAIAFFSYGPARLIEAGFFGVIYEALNAKGPATGVRTGLRIHTQLVVLVAFTFMTAAFMLMSWDFRLHPGVFWFELVGVIVILLTMLQFNIPHTKLIPICLIGYVGIMMAGGIWQSLGVPTPQVVLTGTDTPVTMPWWVIPAALAALAFLAFAFFLNKKSGLASKPIALPGLQTLAIIAVVAAAGLWGYNHFFSHSATAGKCSQARIIAEPGALITVPANCPVYVDQQRWTDGLDYDLADDVQRQQLGNTSQQFVSHAMLWYTTHREEDRHIMVLIPNQRSFERNHLQSLEMILYPRGTAPHLAKTSVAPAAGLDWMKPKQ